MVIKNFFMILGIVAVCLALMMGAETVAQVQLPKAITPLKPVTPIPLFETAYGIYFEMSPPTLTIRYGTNVLNISQGQSQVINLPENSPLLDSNHNLPVTIEYNIRNKTTKNLRFRVGFRQGNTYLANQDLTFFGQRTIHVQHSVRLASSQGHLTILVEGLNILASTSDDTRPVFFNGRLWLRVYAV